MLDTLSRIVWISAPGEEAGWGGGGAGGWRLLGLIFARYWLLASQNPYPIIGYSVANYYRPHRGQFWENVIFAIQLRHFLFMRQV